MKDGDIKTWKERTTGVQQLVRLLFNNHFAKPGLVLLKDKSGIGMIGDKIQDYIVMNISYFSHHCLSLLCEITYSNKRPKDSDVIKAKNQCFADVMLNAKGAILLSSCLLIAAGSVSWFYETCTVVTNLIITGWQLLCLELPTQENYEITQNETA